jgi:IclR family pca regulon transcriptional regulator
MRATSMARSLPSPGGEPLVEPERDASVVRAFERGLSVIRALSEPGAGQTLADVARATGMTRAAARRFLSTLVALGYARHDGRHFTLTPRTLELGYAYLSSLGLPELAQPHLRDLVGRVDESSSISVLDGPWIVYVAREPTRRIMSVALNVGTRLPAHATSMGRVLMAALEPAELDALLAASELTAGTERTITDPAALRRELAKVARQGWAIVDQELEIGLRSVAAPIRDPSGRVVAAVNISTHANRTPLERMRRELLPPLLETATRIGAELPSRRA